MSKQKLEEPAVLAVSEVRRALIVQGDIRNEVGYQNDINLLLSSLEGANAPWQALAPIFAPMKPRAPRPVPVRTDDRESRTGRHRTITHPRIDRRRLEAR